MNQVTSQYVIPNGVYVFKWDRVNRSGLRDTMSKKDNRDFEDEIEQNLTSLEYEYIYRYCPTQYKNVTLSHLKTEWIYKPSSDEKYQENNDRLLKQIILVHGANYEKMSFLPYVDTITFKIDRSIYPNTIEYKEKMNLPIKLWVVEKLLLDYFESKYFGLKEIESLQIL